MNWNLTEISASRAPAGVLLGAILHRIHGEKIMNTILKPTFIVVTEHGYWGAHERLAEACRNAKLEEQSVVEATCYEIQTALESA